MTQKLHLSYRLPNGTIAGIGGDTVAELRQNLTDLFGHGDTAQDIIALLQHTVISSIPTNMPGAAQAQANVGQAFPQAQPVADPYAGAPEWAQPQGYQPQQQPQQRPVAGPPPGQVSPTCKHGARNFKSGFKSDGTPWAAWFCPSPKGTPDQCKPQWQNS